MIEDCFGGGVHDEMLSLRRGWLAAERSMEVAKVLRRRAAFAFKFGAHKADAKSKTPQPVRG